MSGLVQEKLLDGAGARSTSNFISIRSVSKTYRRDGSNGVTALTPIDIEIRNGEFVVVVGPSGCGKSTLLQILSGLLRPTTGTIYLAGTAIDGPRRDIGIVFQNPILLPWRNVLNNVLLPAVVHRTDRSKARKRAMELLELVNLAGFEKHFPRELSGGMEQRVALARALMNDPNILLMDEPFGALDAMTREQMNMELQKLWLAAGKSVFLITHSISEAVFLADRVLVLSARPGRLLADIPIDLPRPRTSQSYGDPRFTKAAARIRELLGLPERLD